MRRCPRENACFKAKLPYAVCQFTLSKMKQTREYLSVLLIFSGEGKNLAHLKRKNKQGTAGLVWQVFKAVTRLWSRATRSAQLASPTGDSRWLRFIRGGPGTLVPPLLWLVTFL